MAGKKSKIIVLAGMIALLVLTGVLNIVINKKAQSVSSGDTTASADFFVTYRADRLATRNQSMLDLDEIIKSGSEEAIKNAVISHAKRSKSMRRLRTASVSVPLRMSLKTLPCAILTLLPIRKLKILFL